MIKKLWNYSDLYIKAFKNSLLHVYQLDGYYYFITIEKVIKLLSYVLILFTYNLMVITK